MLFQGCRFNYLGNLGAWLSFFAQHPTKSHATLHGPSAPTCSCQLLSAVGFLLATSGSLAHLGWAFNSAFSRGVHRYGPPPPPALSLGLEACAKSIDSPTPVLRCFKIVTPTNVKATKRGSLWTSHRPLCTSNTSSQVAAGRRSTKITMDQDKLLVVVSDARIGTFAP